MNLKELRATHQTFEYHSFETKKSDNSLEIAFNFRISPDIEFNPRVSIPLVENTSEEDTANFVFHLGMIEAISYWKSTCSPEIVVGAGNLTVEQVRWWHDLYTHGLGEFYYQNGIDFSAEDFVNINSKPDAPHHPLPRSRETDGDLILVGGGKDSVVSLEMLRSLEKRSNVLLLNPTVAATETSRIAGYPDPITIKREIDRKLIELNNQGYLNGHTPFSAYLSFLSVFTGFLHGYENVIASNESSAGEGNILFHGIEVNHQYSKSLRYEKLFDEYRRKHLTGDVKYFSFLRPLYELQIASLFTQTEKYDQAFCSCNVSRNAYWCGECPKCAFVYLSLSPFMDTVRRQSVFGEDDFFEKPEIQKHVVDLVGLGEHKPFECVGTEDESRLALLLAVEGYKSRNQAIPLFIEKILSQLNLSEAENIDKLKRKIKTDWDDDHLLPKEYKNLLLQKMSQL